MQKADWKKVTVGPKTTLSETIARFDASALQVALVADDTGRLLGVVTDGDIRRAILRGVTLESPITMVMNPHPKTLRAGATRDEILGLMRLECLDFFLEGV